MLNIFNAPVLVRSHNNSGDDSGTNMDIMVVWTSSAECAASGLSMGCTLDDETELMMRNLIDLAIDETNDAFLQSGVESELLLVEAYRDESYNEATTNAFGTALRHIAESGDGVMDDVHSKRELFGADIVAMIISDSHE